VTGSEGYLRSGDGVLLYWRGLAAPDPRAVLVLVHGLGEHVGRYVHVQDFFAGRGLATYAFDLRGHGRSAGLQGHVDRFADYLEDLGAVLEHARSQCPGVPVVLLGHSMGGLVALRHAQLEQGLLGLVLSSPLLGIAEGSRPAPARAALGRVASLLAPRLRFRTSVDPALLSRDPAVGAAYAADPLVGRKVSARWFTSVSQAIEEAHAAEPRLPLPALVMAAGQDALADSGATRRFVEGATGARAELQEWDGLYHEILNAPERALVLERAWAWVAERLAA